MNRMSAALLLLGAGVLSQAAMARPQATAALQALDDQLPGDLVNDPASMAWKIYGKDVTHQAVRDASIPGGGAANQVNIRTAGANPWDVNAEVPILTGIKSGQTVTVGFYARTLSANTNDKKGLVSIRVQQNVSPFAGLIDKTVAIGTDWAFHEVSGKANRDIASGQAVVALQLAGARQELQLGQIIVVTDAPSISPGAASDKAGDSAAQTVTLPASLQGKGTLLLDPAQRDRWIYYGSNQTHASGGSLVMGVKTIRVDTSAPAEHPYDTGITVLLDRPVSTGDELIIAVAVRTIASDAADGSGKVIVRAMKNAAPWPGFGDKELSFPAGKWQMMSLRTEATTDLPAGQGAVQLQIGGTKQSLEMGPVFVLKAAPAP